MKCSMWLPADRESKRILIDAKSGDLAQALARAEALVEQTKATDPSESIVYADALLTLGYVHMLRDEFDRDIPLTREATRIFAREYGVASEEYAYALSKLPYSLVKCGRLDEAEIVASEALHILERLDSSGQSPDMSMVLGNMVMVLAARGEIDKAESLCVRYQRLAGDQYGEKSLPFAERLLNLARVYMLQKRWTPARRALERSIRLHEESSDRIDEYIYASSLRELAKVHQESGDTTVARDLYGRALEILKRVGGPEYPDTRTVRDRLMKLESATSSPDASSA